MTSLGERVISRLVIVHAYLMAGLPHGLERLWREDESVRRRSYRPVRDFGRRLGRGCGWPLRGQHVHWWGGRSRWLGRSLAGSFEAVRAGAHPGLYRRQRHMPGRWFSTTAERFLEYESLLERDWMLLLDFDREVEWICEQRGAWLLRWQLGWSAVCVRHRVLLARACRACGTVSKDVLRSRWVSDRHGPLSDPTRCARRLGSELAARTSAASRPGALATRPSRRSDGIDGSVGGTV